MVINYRSFHQNFTKFEAYTPITSILHVFLQLVFSVIYLLFFFSASHLPLHLSLVTKMDSLNSNDIQRFAYAFWHLCIFVVQTMRWLREKIWTQFKKWTCQSRSTTIKCLCFTKGDGNEKKLIKLYNRNL